MKNKIGLHKLGKMVNLPPNSKEKNESVLSIILGCRI